MPSGDMTIVVYGDASLKRFAGLPRTVQRRILNQSIRKFGTMVKRRAESLTPVRTGKLKRGIEKFTRRSRREVGFVVRTKPRDHFGIASDSKWYYPAIVEFGPRAHRNRARPYLKPALREVEPLIGPAVRADVEAAVRELDRGGRTFL